jgi:hypothetical protein
MVIPQVRWIRELRYIGMGPYRYFCGRGQILKKLCPWHTHIYVDHITGRIHLERKTEKHLQVVPIAFLSGV